jgi:hypothetical protein
MILIIVVAAVAAVMVLGFGRTVRIVPQARAYVVERLGSYSAAPLRAASGSPPFTGGHAPGGLEYGRSRLYRRPVSWRQAGIAGWRGARAVPAALRPDRLPDGTFEHPSSPMRVSS